MFGGGDVIVSIFKKIIFNIFKKENQKNKQEQDAAGIRTTSPLKT